jgi:hypothetical protein
MGQSLREIAEERALLLQRLTALRQRLDSAARPTTADTLDADFHEVDAAVSAARIARTQHEERARQLKKGSSGNRVGGFPGLEPYR